MRIRIPHAPYIANKIAIDIFKTGFVKLHKGVEPIAKVAQDLLEIDIKKEMALEERVNEILDENAEDMEFMQIDTRSMFWLIKKKIAPEYNFILSYEERFSELSHQILDELLNRDLIEFNVSENRVKNSIYSSIEGYLNSYENVEDKVIEKIENYKRKLVPGSDEYEVIFEKLYQEELRKLGML